MKKLTCEMCGSTEMLKQDGVFVCQTCGTKYSVEEAKRMMVEVEGTVAVKNAAQLDNVLKLAQSSFDSENYSQAEEFCNQVLSMDDKNYEAWKLKGEAINFQISAKNQRILEVYNCIMTSYRVLDDEEKKVKKFEVLFALRSCFEGEIDFWLKQFEANRPTDSALTRAKTAYLDAYKKMAGAYDELELNELKDDYLINFANFFINRANSICVSAWKSTVGYNYYRDDFDNLGAKWGRGNAWSNMVSTNTDSYRPRKDTALTFLNEGNNLIELLKFAEEQFNSKTEYESKKNVYDNIIYFHKRLSDLVYYKIDSNSASVGWFEDGSLTDEAKSVRKNIIDSYNKKIEAAKNADINEKTEKVKKECKDTPTNEVFEAAMENIMMEEYIEADAHFSIIVERKPDSPVGYVGKALANCCADNKYVEYIRKAAEYKPTSDEDRERLAMVINEPNHENNITLLMSCAAAYDYESVEYLVASGADVHAKCNGATALWLVCYSKIDENKVEAARKTAEILLNSGAEVDVVNDGGVALLNPNTEYGIIRLIKERYPDATLGEAAYKPPAKSSGGCYVATAVYGSYDCPQVWTLRRYRDDVLAKSWYGRTFIHTYYAVSPTLVKWFGNKQWFKTMWQGKLDRMVADLQAKGVESTPYEDRKWN